MRLNKGGQVPRGFFPQAHDILSDKDALELARNVSAAILKGEAVHQIATERLAHYVMKRASTASLK